MIGTAALWRVGPPAPEGGRPPARRQAAPGEIPLSEPSVEAVGLDRYVGSWISADGSGRQAFTFNGGGKVGRVVPLPVPVVTGLTVGEAEVWTSDPARLYRHDMRTLEPVAFHAAPGNSVSAIHWDWDGVALWSADRRRRRAYRHRPSREGLVLRGEYPLFEGDPAGLWVRDGRLWVFDRSRQTIRRYRLGDPMVVEGHLDLPEIMPRRARARAFALYEDRLWMLSEPPASITSRPLDALSWKVPEGD